MDQDARTTTAVLAAEDSFFGALLAADQDTLREVLADDFLIVDVMGGQVAAKGDLLGLIGSGDLRFLDVIRSPDDVTVRLRESTAVVIGRTQMAIRYEGGEASTKSRYTHVYVRDGERWQLLSAQGTPTDW